MTGENLAFLINLKSYLQLLHLNLHGQTPLKEEKEFSLPVLYSSLSFS